MRHGVPGDLAGRADRAATLGDLAATIKDHKLWKHTLVLVGPALAAAGTRSHLYHPGHFHGYRRADRQARQQLRQTRQTGQTRRGQDGP